MLKKPWLYLPASMSHNLGPVALRALSKLKKRPFFDPSKTIELMGLKFSHPFGTAGGLDKTAKDINTWYKWGASFLELGSFTPLAQGPNPGKIIDRDLNHKALWNCMGFPNPGFAAVKPYIKKFKNKHSQTPLFINIGKNRTTPLEKASEDYIKGLDFFSDVADCFVINISSPNTAGLRDLHKKENFKAFIDPIIEHKHNRSYSNPLLLKLSPDLDQSSYMDFMKVISKVDIDGLVLTNTTSSRTQELSFPEHGGVSGAPLKQLSLEKLIVAKNTLGDSKVLVSVGGVLTPEEACNRIQFGADLVQFYSGLIFYGPHLIKHSVDKWA